MTLLRRFLVLQLLMIWQGGFLFYALIVVPIGTRMLGGAFEQGKITRFVTTDLNLIGVIALAVFVWELFESGRSAPRRRWLLWSTWLVMAAGLLALCLLHPRMAAMVHTEAFRLTGDRAEFHLMHRIYLWVSTIQWAAGLAFALALVRSWRTADRDHAGAVTLKQPDTPVSAQPAPGSVP